MQSFKEYFLVENIDSKLPILLKQFGAQLQKRYETAYGVVDLNGVAKLAKREIQEMDPTPGADYATWIIRMRINKSIRGDEDFDKVKERLTQFQSLKKTGRFTAPKDINQYKTFGDLAKVLDEYVGVMSKGEEKKLALEQGVKQLDQYGEYTLYAITTPEAAAKVFRDTDWCVKNPKFFNQYMVENPDSLVPKIKDSTFYYIRHPDRNKWALAHFKSNQLKDVHDNTFDPRGNNSISEDVAKAYHALLSKLPAYQELKKICSAVPSKPVPVPLEEDGVFLFYSTLPPEAQRMIRTAPLQDVCQTFIHLLKTEPTKSAAKQGIKKELLTGKYDVAGSEFAPILALDGLTVKINGWIYSEESTAEDMSGDHVLDFIGYLKRKADPKTVRTIIAQGARR
jgi:hypothetical protein